MAVAPQIQKILNLGVCAPSGDNSQPWEFKVTENQIQIFNLPDKDLPFYNFAQRGSLLAHGALIENIAIAARELGYSIEIELLPNKQNQNHTATIILATTTPKHEPLYQAISQRATNRKKYQNTPLTDNERQQIFSAAPHALILIEDTAKQRELGHALSINEIIAIETEEIHNQFFGHIIWTEAEEKEQKSGLYLKTMELPPPARFIFRRLRHWKTAKRLIALGITKLIAKTNAHIYASGAAIGAIIIPSREPKQYIEGGRIMEKVWLTATNLGLQFHPITGIAFLGQKVADGHTEGLSPRHLELLQNAYQVLMKIFNLQGNNSIAMMFRIGRGDPPTARCSRKAPYIMNEK